MRFLMILSSLLQAFVLLLLCCLTKSAPTHHLTIGVQGNTPTLIVTSSEIGITPETMGLPKKTHKMASYMDKVINKDLKVSEFKDTLKTKLNKSRFQNNKKEKHLKLNEKSDKLGKSLSQEMDQKTFTLNKENFKTTTTATLLDKSATTTTYKMPNNIKQPHLEPVLPGTVTKISNLLKTTTTTPLSSQEIDASTTTINHEDATTLVFKSKSLNQLDLQTNEKVLNNKDNNDDDVVVVVNQTLLQTSNILPDITDVLKTQTENNDSDSSTQYPAVTIENENLLSTTIETKIVSPTTTTTTTTTSTPTTLPYVNNAKTTETFITGQNTNVEATTPKQILSLSSLTAMVATEIIADDEQNKNNNDNESVQSKSEHKAVMRLTVNNNGEKSQNELRTTGEAMVITTAASAENNRKEEDLKLDTEMEEKPYTTTFEILDRTSDTTTTPSAVIESSSESLVTREEVLKFKDMGTKAQSSSTALPSILKDIFSAPTEMENLQPITTLEALNLDHQSSTITPLIESSSERQITAERILNTKDLETNKLKQPLIPVSALKTTTESSATTATTTEKILKLIDLEQHVLKTIDDLKQPSLLMAGQHDNGHDGVKNIKKKQLVDKHYVEALLHNKQDNHKMLDILSGMSATTTTKPVLMPIKHGYLGPIFMEEKTFHVIRQKDKTQTNKNPHKTKDIEKQLRQGHFVELKAKAEEKAPATKSVNSTFEISKAAKVASSTEKIFIPETETQVTTKNQATETSLTELRNDAPPTLPYFPEADDRNISFLETGPQKAAINQSVTTTEKVFDKVPQPKDSTKILSSHISSLETSSISTSQNISSLEVLPQKQATVLSTTVFQVIDTMATKTPMVQASTMFTSEDKENSQKILAKESKQTESKISDIQIEVYDSTIDSIVASTNFKDSEKNRHDESSLGKTTKPPIALVQQERFTQYVIDRTETSTQEPINYSTIQVASGKPEPAAIEIHINVSESFGNESEDLDFSYPQTEFNNNNEKLALADDSYDENIKLKIPSNGGVNANNKDPGNDEILVVEIIDTDNMTDASKSKAVNEIFITDVKDHYTTPPPPPPPPPYQTNFDRDSDTIFYISNTEVKVGESLPNTQKSNEERKLKLESQFFPVNYMASTHPNINSPEETQHAVASPHHLYEEDIILSSNHNQQDSLKIYRNRNEPSPPLDVTYVGESIIEVEQSPDTAITTTYAPEQQQQQQHLQTAGSATPQADVIIQPAILPEISIGVPVIGELPPQIELKEIDFMPNEAQLHRSGMYDDNDNSNINSNDIDDNNNHESNSNNNNLHVDESSIQYGGDLIDESADGGFDGVEGSYPFGNPAITSKSYTSSYLTKLRKQQQQQQQQQQHQPNHVADYAHLYVNYGVNNMRKDELSADIKDSAEMFSITGVGGGGGGGSGINNEQNLTTFKDFLNKVSQSNSSQAYLNANSTTQSERMSNATAFSVMEDANDLEDKNTEDIINLISLAIGLFIVILPVVVTCSMFWALRYLYKKYHSNITDNGGYADQTETKVPLNEDGMEKGEDISRVARETKMDYNKDGVFVVEVARGIDSKTIPESPVTDGGEKMLSMFDTKQNNGGVAAYKITNEKNCVNNEKVQIHSPPQENTEDGPRSLHQIEEVDEPINSPHLNDNKDNDGNNEGVSLAYNCNTGLSQSDLSSTSSNDSNKDYCYGNQALYVVEQNGYPTTPPTGNVVLKCDVKDIKDDDRNPGNDHYLKHSPNKKEEGKNKEDVLETTEKTKEGGSRTNSGESPAQKPSDKGVKEIKEVLESEENSLGVEEKKEILKDALAKTQIPVKIEVHASADIVRDQDEANECVMEAQDETSSAEIVSKVNSVVSVCLESEVCSVPKYANDVSSKEGKDAIDKEKVAAEVLPLDTEEPIQSTEVNSMTRDANHVSSRDGNKEVLRVKDSPEVLPLDIEKSIETTLPVEVNKQTAKESVINEVGQDVLSHESLKSTVNEEETQETSLGNLVVLTIPESSSNITEKQDNTSNDCDIIGNPDAYAKNENLTENATKDVLIVLEQSKKQETDIENNYDEDVYTNGFKETPDETSNVKSTDMNSLTNGSSTLPDAVTSEANSESLQNGHHNDSMAEMENGYDSLLSLPAPPPTTDELQLSPDISDQQMDSLPPPPPPEIFSLKDLPQPTPTLTNGCHHADSPQSEESTNNFYNTLPPPPPTTLAVSATAAGGATAATTNGKLHASPLTPPASPPAHYTNNLHVGLCSQPIAVDVNGS